LKPLKIWQKTIHFNKLNIFLNKIIFKMKHFSIIFCLMLAISGFAQTGTLKGRILNAANNEPIPLASVIVKGTTNGVQSDLDGNYELTGLQPGLYDFIISFVGFKDKQLSEVQLSNNKPQIIDILLEETTTELKNVVVKAAAFKKTEESPVSLRTIGVAEIQRAPGGNRDISKVIQSLPGVTSTAAFRNDLIIRGGAPSENRFYLDDVEVPNINHFATQGSSGGPVGLINVDFVREVDFFSGAFPSNRGNALSSMFNFRFKEGRDDRIGATFTAGTSDLGVTVEGPMTKKNTFLASARRSNLQLLFKAIGLPFLPIYNDFQFKTKIKLDQKNEITLIGLGAIDEFALNLKANETEAQRIILDFLPVQTQWNYTNGIVYKHFYGNSYLTAVLSRNMLNNESYKYKGNDESSEENLNSRYKSQEIENKLRVENTQRFTNGIKLNYGINLETDRYNNRTYFKNGFTTVNYYNEFDMTRYGAFGQISKRFLTDALTLSAGLRTDANNYSSDMNNPLEQLSPRFSAAYAITGELSANFNTGIYYQMPAYTTLGYKKTSDGDFVNKTNGLKYIKAGHIVAGLEYNFKNSSKATIEGFYKNYENYPMAFLQTGDTVNLANLGAGFGVVGNSPVQSTGKGRTYGMEVLYQQRLWKGFYGIMAYTLAFSEFTNPKGEYRPSAWDSRHIIALTVGKKFARNWEIGAKWRFQSGLPYTPVDVDRSSIVPVWNATGAAILDYSQTNSQRYKETSIIDLRIDKKWFFKKFNINLYADLQNLTSYKLPTQTFVLDRDDKGNPKPPVAGSDGILRYPTKFLETGTGNLTPNLGVIFEY
jgi:CarboxypepD_reg-like domain/TonB dependent receptor/TonB-dependent Receptor Plug Domain